MRGVGDEKSIEPGGFRREPQKQPTCLGTVTMQLVGLGGDGASEAGDQIKKVFNLLSQEQWGAIEGPSAGEWYDLAAALWGD